MAQFRSHGMMPILAKTRLVLLIFTLVPFPISGSGPLHRFFANQTGSEYRFACPVVGTKCLYGEKDFETIVNPSKAGDRVTRIGIFIDSEEDLILEGCRPDPIFYQGCKVLCHEECTCTVRDVRTNQTQPCVINEASPDDSLKKVEETCDIYTLTFDLFRDEPAGGFDEKGVSYQAYKCELSTLYCSDVGPYSYCNYDDNEILCCVETKFDLNSGLGFLPFGCSPQCTKDIFPLSSSSTAENSSSSSSQSNEFGDQQSSLDDPLMGSTGDNINNNSTTFLPGISETLSSSGGASIDLIRANYFPKLTVLSLLLLLLFGTGCL